MKLINGKYNTAIIYADTVDDNAVQQIETMCNLEFLQDSKLRIMCDVHAGAGCTIGTTMTITDAIVPNFVGVDIGCGMEVVRIKEKELDLEALDQFIYDNIPSGFDIHRKNQKCSVNLTKLKCVNHININRAYKSVGTLGSGNHFLEVNKDNENNLYIVIHSGSRHLGKEVAEYYQKEAYYQLNKMTRADILQLIDALKKEGREQEIQAEIQKLKENIIYPNKELAYCKGQLFDDYLHDMQITQEYAMFNRKVMMSKIIEHFNLSVEEQFTTIHNYIDLENMILRKGAVSAQKGEKLLIPINMKEGSLLCIGKGNPEWNYSAPHGAGRLLSRAEAYKTLSLEEYIAKMEGIYTTSVSRATLDESPMAYKSMDEIINNVHDTVEIVANLKPIYNFKAAEKPKWKKITKNT